MAPSRTPVRGHGRYTAESSDARRPLTSCPRVTRAARLPSIPSSAPPFTTTVDLTPHRCQRVNPPIMLITAVSLFTFVGKLDEFGPALALKDQGIYYMVRIHPNTHIVRAHVADG